MSSYTDVHQAHVLRHGQSHIHTICPGAHTQSIPIVECVCGQDFTPRNDEGHAAHVESKASIRLLQAQAETLAAERDTARATVWGMTEGVGG